MINGKKVFFLYNGQGSQYFGMCKEYYYSDDDFRKIIDRLNDDIYDKTGYSVIDYVFNGGTIHDRCDMLDYTHMAICMVEYAITKIFEKHGIIPDYLVGSSLGEYVCMAVSEMLPLNEVFHLLTEQTVILKNECPRGRMLSVLDDYRNNKDILKNVDLVSVNYEKHFVVSGGIYEIDSVKRQLAEKKVDAFEIPVNYPFHSSLLDCVKNSCIANTDKYFKCKEGKIKVLSSSKCGISERYTSENLWNIIRFPIRYRELITKFCDDDSILIDVGPASTLAGFSRNILKRYKGIYGIISPFNTEKRSIEKIIAELKGKSF